MLVNSETYPQQSSPVDSTVEVGLPCQTSMVDVKLTETDIPWLFGLSPALGIPAPDFINAHARVKLVQVDTLSGQLPIGVPEVNPTKAKVQFVNEDLALDDPARVLGESPLTAVPGGATNGLSR